MSIKISEDNFYEVIFTVNENGFDFIPDIIPFLNNSQLGELISGLKNSDSLVPFYVCQDLGLPSVSILTPEVFSKAGELYKFYTTCKIIRVPLYNLYLRELKINTILA